MVTGPHQSFCRRELGQPSWDVRSLATVPPWYLGTQNKRSSDADTLTTQAFPQRPSSSSASPHHRGDPRLRVE